MDNLTVEGWLKELPGKKPIALERIHFHISPECHLALEAAEEELHKTRAPEKFVNVELRELELQIHPEVGPLSDCQLRVYLGEMDSRGQFHLVGHRASDNGLIYTNPVMVDQLG